MNKIKDIRLDEFRQLKEEIGGSEEKKEFSHRKMVFKSIDDCGIRV